MKLLCGRSTWLAVLAVVATASFGPDYTSELLNAAGVQAAGFPIPGTEGGIRDIQFVGSYGLASVAAGLLVLDVSDAGNPTIVTTLPLGSPRHVLDGHYRIAVRGHYAFVPMYEGGVFVVDISDPANPVEVTQVVTPRWAREVITIDDYLYVGGPDSGLMVYNAVDPAAPLLVGITPERITVRDFARAGSLLLVPGFAFHVYDVSDPSQPSAARPVIGPARTNAVRVRGNLAYVTDELEQSNGLGGLAVFDLTADSVPVLLGAVDSHDYDLDVALANRVAYAVSDGFGLHAIDISDPTAPTVIKCYELNSPICGGPYSTPQPFQTSVTIHGHYAYVCADTRGLWLFELDGRGDCNGDSLVTAADIIWLVNYIFKGGSPPTPLAQGNTDCFDGIAAADIITMVNYVFKSGDPLVCP